MKRIFERTVSERLRGKRLDHYLMASGIGLSRSQLHKLIAAGSVLVNGRVAKPSYRVKDEDHIIADFDLEEPFKVEPEAIELPVVYEDSELIVINKPVNMVVHPARGHARGTMVNALLHHCRTLPVRDGCKIRPGVLHRLDKDTTGLIVFAKTDESLTNLGRQVEGRKLKREYQAIVWGDLALAYGTIDAPVGRSTIDRKRMAVTPFSSRTAITRFEVTERFGIATLVRLRLETGRTHQIRVHMMHYGHPVVGDPEYGGRSRNNIRSPGEISLLETMLSLIRRQALHASRLGFYHPKSGEFVEFEAPLPDDFRNLLGFLRSLKCPEAT